MKYDDLTSSQRSILLNNVAFHREHYARWIGHLEAQSFPPDDRLKVAVEQAKQAVDSLLFLLAERQQPSQLRQSTTQ